MRRVEVMRFVKARKMVSSERLETRVSFSLISRMMRLIFFFRFAREIFWFVSKRAKKREMRFWVMAG